MALARDSPSIQGDVPGPDPARAPPSKAAAGRVRLSGAAGGGLPCLGKVRHARSAAAPASESCLSTFGPHAIGTERSPTVPQRYVVPAGHPCDPGEMSPAQNPDKTPMAVGRHEGLRIGGPGRARLSLVRQSPCYAGDFRFRIRSRFRPASRRPSPKWPCRSCFSSS
jgi:hypothetical protein